MKIFLRTGLLAAAFLIALYLTLHDPFEDEALHVWDVSLDEILSVKIERPAGAYQLIRVDGEWWVQTADERFLGDSSQVKRRLGAITQPHVKALLGGNDRKIADLETYGLAPSQYKITVIYDEGESRSMLVGSLTPLKDAYYARQEGQDSIMLVSFYNLMPLLEAGLDALRKKSDPVPEAEPESPSETGA